jgi:DNA-binding beta-propeller fold protein YncE
MKTVLRLGALFFLAGLLPAAAAMLLVAGQESDNLMIFDPATARFAELAKFTKGSKPRTVAVSPKGEIFVGFSGGARSIVRVAPGNPVEIKPVTKAIGTYGPGVLVFAGSQLWVSGDTERVIYQVNTDTGELTVPAQEKTADNVVGIAVADNRVYLAEYGSGSILTRTIGSGRLSGERELVTKSPHLKQPREMIVTPQGDLLAANVAAATVAQFDRTTGDHLRNLIDLGFAGQAGLHGLAYAPGTRRFYVGSGYNLFETAETGAVLAAYGSPALRRVDGLALLAALPAGFTPKPAATLKRARAGLSIIGVPGERYQVMVSTDHKKWDPIPTPDNPAQQASFSDPAATAGVGRVYRLDLR